MPLKISCPNRDCAASYKVDESVLGRTVRCKKCGRTFIARDESPSPPTSGDVMTSPDPGIDIPNPFGKYYVLKKIGEGGMGAVYLAFDEDLERRVALKV